MLVKTLILDTLTELIQDIRDGSDDYPERSELDFIRRLVESLDLGDLDGDDRVTIIRIIDFIGYAPGTLRPFTTIELLGDIETILER